MNFLTAIAVVVAITVLGFIADWIDRRVRRFLDDSYWRCQRVPCPNCERQFSQEAIASRGTAIFESKYIGAVLTCSHCGTAYEFCHTKEGPSYIGLARQCRRCRTCNDCYLGLPDDCCPTCGSCTDRIVDGDFAKSRLNGH